MYLLEQTGVLCYDFIDSWQKLNDTLLPSMNAFYNILNQQNITAEQYTFANQIWSKFNIQTLGEYTDLYLDVA